MIRNNKGKAILSSILILLPILAGLILWKDLPDHMTTHWGFDGAADGWSSRNFAIFGLPLILLALHWFCLLITAKDPGNKNQSRKISGMVFWICPLTSLFTNSLIYFSALGREFKPEAFTFLFLGIIFIVIGNYMPKCRQNYTIGVKIKWTLQSEENWNATHRFAGKIWLIGGILILLCIFLPTAAAITAMCIIVTVLAIIPMIYSYRYYRKQKETGFTPKWPGSSGNSDNEDGSGSNSRFGKNDRRIAAVSIILVILVTIFCLVLCFTGDIAVKCGDTSFTIEASYWDDLTVDYDVIDSLEYREDCDAGMRTYGFGTPRLSMGTFRNDEFGSYTRYAYTGCDSCIVLESEGKILVLSGQNEEETKQIYEEISERADV